MEEDVLLIAINEIKQLRQRNEVLSAKSDVLDILAAALGMRRGGEAQCVDVVWQLQRAIDDEKYKREKQQISEANGNAGTVVYSVGSTIPMNNPPPTDYQF